MRVTAVGKCSPTSITVISTLSTRGVSIKEIASFLVTCVTAPSRNAIAFAYISCTCTRNIDLTNATNVESAFPSLPAWINICECTVERDLTNVHIAARLSRRHLFWGHTFANTVERSHSNVAIVARPLLPTRRMIATWDARTQRKSLVSASFVAKRSPNRTNWSFTWTCTRGRNRTLVKGVAVASQVLRHVIDIGRTLTARRERTEHQK